MFYRTAVAPDWTSVRNHCPFKGHVSLCSSKTQISRPPWPSLFVRLCFRVFIIIQGNNLFSDHGACSQSQKSVKKKKNKSKSLIRLLWSAPQFNVKQHLHFSEGLNAHARSWVRTLSNLLKRHNFNNGQWAKSETICTKWSISKDESANVICCDIKTYSAYITLSDVCFSNIIHMNF